MHFKGCLQNIALYYINMCMYFCKHSMTKILNVYSVWLKDYIFVKDYIVVFSELVQIIPTKS